MWLRVTNNKSELWTICIDFARNKETKSCAKVGNFNIWLAIIKLIFRFDLIWFVCNLSISLSLLFAESACLFQRTSRDFTKLIERMANQVTLWLAPVLLFDWANSYLTGLTPILTRARLTFWPCNNNFTHICLALNNYSSLNALFHTCTHRMHAWTHECSISGNSI